MGMGVHAIDLLRYLVGSEVVAVTAMSDGQTADRPLDRFVQASLEFQGGVFAHLVCSGRFPYSRNDAVVYGSRGRVASIGGVDMFPGRGHLEVIGPPGDDGATTASFRRDVPDHFVREIEAFGRAVREGAHFEATGLDGLRAVEITSAILQSLTTGRRIRIVPTEV